MTRKLAGHFFLFEASAAFTEFLEVSTGNCGHGIRNTFWKYGNCGQCTPWNSYEAAQPTSRPTDRNRNPGGERKTRSVIRQSSPDNTNPRPILLSEKLEFLKRWRKRSFPNHFVAGLARIQPHSEFLRIQLPVLLRVLKSLRYRSHQSEFARSAQDSTRKSCRPQSGPSAPPHKSR